MSTSVSCWGAQNRTWCGLASGFLPLGKGQDHFALSAVTTPPNAAQDANFFPSFQQRHLVGLCSTCLPGLYSGPFLQSWKKHICRNVIRSVAFMYYCMSLGFMVNKHVSIWWWNLWLAWNHCVLWWEVKIFSIWFRFKYNHIEIIILKN